MGHLLSVDDDDRLHPDEIIHRWRKEFQSINFDQKKGREQISEMIRLVRKGKGKRYTKAQADYRIGFLDSIKDQAYYVTIFDDENRDVYLSMLVRPEEDIFISYHSLLHEERARPLLERCARAIGYDIELV